MQQLHAEIEIDAPAEVVWRVITDFAAYPEWNPFIVRAAGDPQPGARITISIQLLERGTTTFRPRILDFEPGRFVRWKGEWFLPGLFDGRHALTVEPLGDDRSRFTTHEDVTGILLPFLGTVMRDSQRGFEAFAAALKSRAEGFAAQV